MGRALLKNDVMAEVPKANTRVSWEQVPTAVRAWVAELLGEPIAGAVSQAGGFSPGAANRLVGARGARIFAKSVSREINQRSFELFRSEAEVWEALGGLSLPSPRFRGCARHADWITLVFDDVEGREPGGDQPDVAAVFAALASLPEISDEFVLPPPPSASASRSAASRAARWAAEWAPLLSQGRALLPHHFRDHADRFAQLASEAGRAAAGTRLAHLDLRPDNAILDASGTAWLVDWPWAGRAAPWFDELSYLTGLASTHPLATLDGWTSHPSTALATAPPEDVDAVLCAQAGMLLWQSAKPSRLSGLTKLQRVFALRLLEWVTLRRSW